jgi:ribose transport system substrate-binding protein
MKRAAAQGIPTVTLLGQPVNDAQVAVDVNAYDYSGELAAYIARLLPGKGHWLYVHGIAGVSLDLAGVGVWNAVAKSCPGTTADAQGVYGAFSAQIAKAEMLKYLATHPQKIDAILTEGYMTPGVMQAFQQTGRPIPAIGDVGPEKGFLGYWKQHAGSYHAAGTTLPPYPGAAATVEVVLRMLAGQGVKLNSIVGTAPLVTDANLSNWAEDGWALDTLGGVSGARDSFLPSKYLDAFFAHPGPSSELGLPEHGLAVGAHRLHSVLPRLAPKPAVHRHAELAQVAGRGCAAAL